MKKFVTINNYGDLIMDKVFFEASYPILFTCTNENKELFLCVCCQNNENGRKWLLNKVSPITIVDLLKDKITIREAFLINNECKISIRDTGKNVEITYNDAADWSEDSIYLPKAGEYIEAEEDEFAEEIAYYTDNYVVSYTGKYDKTFEEALEFVENELVSYASDISTIEEKIKITTSKFVQILLDVNDLQLDKMKQMLIEYSSNCYQKQIADFQRLLNIYITKEKQETKYEVVDDDEGSDILDAA